MTDDRRVIVIGSGPSGAAAALMLLQCGVPVTLLESGAVYPSGLMLRAFGRNLFRKWAPAAEAYPFIASGDPATEWRSALAPGGLSNYWTGAVPRFSVEDFSEGERLHERYRWPVSYADVAPYYTRAERLLGVVGERRAIPQMPPPEVLIHERRLPRAWRAVADHAERVGQGLVYSPLADGPNWFVRRTGVAFNSFERVVMHLARFPHFDLRLGAHAQRLTWNAQLGRVDGVEYVDRATGRPARVNGSAVVVAAGPLASPKLLLQSASADFPNGLGNSQGVLGRFLHDHPKDWSVLEVNHGLPRLDQPIHVSRAPYARSAPLMGAAQTIGPLSKWDRVLSFAEATTTRFGLQTFGTMLPEARNYVQLHPDQRDRFGMPVLDIHITYGDEVQRTVDEAHRQLGTILGMAGLSFRIESALDRLVPGSSFHYAGAARMHASPEHGVLNGWNRLHDVDNVAVVDASSFTTGVEKNPTLTSMALASRAAERLAHDLRRGDLGRTRTCHAVSTIR